MTDHQLLRLFSTDPRGTGSAAMQELVRRHIDMVHATALREARRPDLADDITQAVFLVLIRRAAKIPPTTFLAGWLFQTTLYAAAEARRKSARRTRHEREVPTMNPTPAAPPDNAHSEELHSHLHQALSKLPHADRDAVVLRYLQGHTSAELATALGTTENTARQRLSRALERLRKSLRSRGILVPAAALAAFLESSKSQAAPPHVLAHVQAITTGTAPAASVHLLAKGALHMAFHAKHLALAAGILVAAFGLGIAAIALNQSRISLPTGEPIAVTPATVPPTPPESPLLAAASRTDASPEKDLFIIYHLRFADATEAARILTTMLSPAPATPPKPPAIPTLKATPNTDTNSLLLSGTPDSIQKARDILDQLDTERKIESGDILTLSIYELVQPTQTYTTHTTVDPTGNITLPNVGKIHLATLTQTQAKDLIAQTCIDKGFLLPPSPTNPAPQIQLALNVRKLN